MRILYEDSQMIVCYKEAGLAVQSARIGTADLVSILKTYLWEKSGGKKEPYLGVVHRLDQPVEGVLVFAKNPQAAKRLSGQVTDGRMKKIYHAVIHVEKEGLSEENCLTDFLLKDGRTNSSSVVSEGTKDSKKAILEYKILEKISLQEMKGQAALAEIHLLTGRHHQIRVQMANAGMPLYGDRKYGAHILEISEKSGNPNGQLALCSVSLSLIHPKTGKKMEFSCKPQGEYFQLFRTY